MRVLFSSTWGYGHVFPLVPLAQAFRDAGHDVLWAASGTAPEVVRGAGLTAVAAGLDPAGVRATEHRLRAALVDVRPDEKAAFAYPTMFGGWAAPPMVEDLLPLARTWRPDLLVHEPGELASPLVGAVLDVPSLTHSFGGAIPPAHVAAAGERLADLWARHDRTPPPYAGCFVSTYVDICPPSVQTVSLDHLGERQPLRPVSWTGASADSESPRDGPLVYLTLGTVASPTEIITAAVAGLADLGLPVLVAVGPQGDPSALGPQPAHVRVERWVDQTAVLGRATLVVSHGGSGTFLGALAAGVPQLCLPQAADQFRNATAATRSGAGLVLPPGQVDAAGVEASARSLLDEPTFRTAAASVAEEIRAMPSPSEVVARLASP